MAFYTNTQTLRNTAATAEHISVVCKGNVLTICILYSILLETLSDLHVFHRMNAAHFIKV